MNNQDSFKNISRLKSKSKSVAAVLKHLAHHQRLLLLCFLSDGEKTVGEIQEITGASQSITSQFLKRLKSERLVDSKKAGQFVYYRIREKKVLLLIKALDKIFCQANS